MQVIQLNAEEAREALPQLIALLKDGMDNGASIGFLPPLAIEEAESYWQKRVKAIQDGEALLIVVKIDGQIVGTAQLGLENRANGNHRAEVQKVIVHTAFVDVALAKF
jgi:acetyltransferase